MGCFCSLALLPDLTVASNVCIVAPSPVTSQPHGELWSGLVDMGELPQVYVNTLTDRGGSGRGLLPSSICSLVSVMHHTTKQKLNQREHLAV